MVAKYHCFSCRSCCGKCAFLILRRRRCCCFGRDIVFNITDAETGENCGDLSKLWAGPLGNTLFLLKKKITKGYIVVLFAKLVANYFINTSYSHHLGCQEEGIFETPVMIQSRSETMKKNPVSLLQSSR